MSKCAYLVFGNGQVAGFIKQYFENVVISKADVTKPQEIERDVRKHHPKYCINTAAMTSLEWCEQNKLKAFEINTLGALNVWEVCKKYNVFLCHFSSGCIYSSKNTKQVYSEDDTPNPESYYSWTKVWSENLVGKDKNLLIVRPRVVISSKVDTRNTLSKWLTFSHFIVDENSVTILEDFIPLLQKMINKKVSGTFNMVNQGHISPYKVALMLRDIVKSDLQINKTSLKKVNKNLISKRVSTILSDKKLQKAGYKLPHISRSIPVVIKKFSDNLRTSEGNKIINKVKGETKYRYTLISKKPSTYNY